MAPSVLDSSGPVSASLLAPLKEHLPHSFALLRRAQFTHFPNGTSPHAHFLFASDPPPGSPAGATSPKHFAAAYLDLSVGPETQMFLYSTLQDAGDDLSAVPDVDVEHVLDLCAALFARVRQIAAATTADCRHALFRVHGVMVGNFHEATYQLLMARRGLASSYWNPHDVWLFRVDELPPPAQQQQQQQQAALGGSMPGTGGEEGRLVWSVVRREDVPLIASRTSLPKVADTLMSEPSVAVRDADGALVAWGFMGIGGTLSTLHVEEPYRGKGIAKALAAKVLREHSFGDDQWGSADVHVDNVQSQGLCKSLGAKKGMRTCWTVINFNSMPVLGSVAAPS